MIIESCAKHDLRLQRCTLAQRNWNHASFSALLTYEKDQHYWQKWWKNQSFINPKKFLELLEKKYEDYLDDDKDKSFEEFLKSTIVITR